MITLHRSLAIGLLVALAGCSGGTDQATSKAALFENVLQVFLSQTTSKKTPLPTLTPELIDSQTLPTLELVVEERDAIAFLTPRIDQIDSRPGALRTWRTVDDSFIVLREGIMVTTRGVGDDIGSTDANAAVAAVRGARPVSGPQTMYLPSEAGGGTRINLSCQMQSLGPKRIVIVERGFDVVHLRQNCTGADEPVINDYWVDRRGGTVWQSRQWGGPGMGYVRMRLLKK